MSRPPLLVEKHILTLKFSSIRNVYFQSPCNLGSELESAMEDSFEAGLPSLAEEREEEEVGCRLDTDRARKISLFNKTGSRFVDTSRPGGPFRHSYIDVRV